MGTNNNWLPGESAPKTGEVFRIYIIDEKNVDDDCDGFAKWNGDEFELTDNTGCGICDYRIIKVSPDFWKNKGGRPNSKLDTELSDIEFEIMAATQHMADAQEGWNSDSNAFEELRTVVQAIIDQAVEAEREECAKICDVLDAQYVAFKSKAAECASSIRSRHNA